MTLPAFDAIAGRQTIAEFVADYSQAEKDMRDGFALVKRGLEALGEGSTLYCQHYCDFGNPDEVATNLRRKAYVARLNAIAGGARLKPVAVDNGTRAEGSLVQA